MVTLKDWFEKASSLEQKTLVKMAGITRMYLYKLIHGSKPSAEVAGRLEVALEELEKGSKGRLPVITRADLCTACANCPYAQRCLKK